MQVPFSLHCQYHYWYQGQLYIKNATSWKLFISLVVSESQVVGKRHGRGWSLCDKCACRCDRSVFQQGEAQKVLGTMPCNSIILWLLAAAESRSGFNSDLSWEIATAPIHVHSIYAFVMFYFGPWYLINLSSDFCAITVERGLLNRSCW